MGRWIAAFLYVAYRTTGSKWLFRPYISAENQTKTRDLALASMAQDDPPASSMAAAMRGKLGSEFEI